MTALSGGHFAADFASGSVPALIPFLTDRFDLNYTLAAVLLLAATVSSSLVQPLFGLWSDRSSALWLIPGGVMLAAVGVAGAVVSPYYPLVVLLVFVGGLGVAAFHPEGAKFAAYSSGEKRAAGMSYFNIGGNTGYALGAFVTGLLVVRFGLAGGVLAMVPVLAAGLALTRLLPYLSKLKPAPRARPLSADDDRRGAMAWLSGVIVLRSVAWFTLLAFVPLWVVAHGHSKEDGTRLLFLMLLSGAVGTLVVGAVADAIGLRRTLLLTQTAIAPLMLVFVYVGGVPRRDRADVRRRLRGRKLRGDDGAEPALPAAPRRHGLGARRRARDGHRRDRRRHPRRRRRLAEPPDGAHDRGRRTGARRLPLPAAPRTGPAAAGRPRAGAAAGADRRLVGPRSAGHPPVIETPDG